MATKKAAAKQEGNLQKAAGGASSSALVDARAQMASEIAKLNERLGAAGGDQIKCTQDKFFELPDGRRSPGPISLVIVDFISMNSFYEEDYDPKNIAPPACFAMGLNPSELVPSNHSPVKQADACGACPQNQFGSGKGNSKACKNTRVLAVLPPGATKDTPLWVMKVSPTGIKAFDAYVKSVAAAFEVAPVGVVTEVSFDPNQTYGSLRFGDPKPNEDFDACFGRRKEAMARLMTEPDVSSYAAPAPAKKVALPARRRV
jgi:hypothetical protein